MLYRRIFTQVPLQCVCNKIIYIKSGKFCQHFSVRVDQAGEEVCQLAVFCVKLSSAALFTSVIMPPGEGIISKLDMSLETFENKVTREVLEWYLAVWFLLDHQSREYLPRTVSTKQGVSLPLMFLSELSTNNYEKGNTFLQIPHNLETALFKFFYLNLFVFYV